MNLTAKQVETLKQIIEEYNEYPSKDELKKNKA